MSQTLTHKILAAHLMEGSLTSGGEVGIRMDQALTQDATGTMAWLQFEALGLDTVACERADSYVDHNTLQMDYKNPDDHRFLQTAAARFGGVFAAAGTGICHQLHLENFARPGATLIGSDSHTPTAGGVGSLAIGAGGLSVALSMAGEAYLLPMPKVVAVRLGGALQGWASAKDVILHLLSLLTVKGGVGKVFEYTGPGVASLSVPERATITNMGAELGATSSVFPSDERTRDFLRAMGREADWQPLQADEGAQYDEVIDIALDSLVPLAAAPHMPDKVVTVASLHGTRVDQAAIGSCTNSSYADMNLVASLFKGKRLAPHTSTLIAPGSKQVLKMLTAEGLLEAMLDAGARLLECACGPCIGSGGAPVSGGVSARTFNRNFEGRSGTQDAGVYLVSPATAAHAALNGAFTDPQTWGPAPKVADFPVAVPSIRHLFDLPAQDLQARKAVRIERGPNIAALEVFEPLPTQLEAQVVLHLGDNVTTDHIMPAGAEILALRSNIPAIARHVFVRVDKDFVERAKQAGNGVLVAGENYGQGSSREHAALAPRHLGIRAVIARSLARIHRANLINFGIVPLVFDKDGDVAAMHKALTLGVRINLPFGELTPGGLMDLGLFEGVRVRVRNDLSEQDIAILRAGGLLNLVRSRLKK